MSGELLRLLCNRPKGWHTLGTVTAAAGGDHLVTIRESVLVARDQYQAHEVTVPLSQLEGRQVYCSACRKNYPVTSLTITDAISRKVGRLVLEPVGFHLDPMGVLQRRGQR